MKKNALITGATGAIGRAIVDVLSKNLSFERKNVQRAILSLHKEFKLNK